MRTEKKLIPKKSRRGILGNHTPAVFEQLGMCEKIVKNSNRGSQK